MADETLTCTVGGHEWTRRKVRGRKPSSCPEHRSGRTTHTGPRPANAPKRPAVAARGLRAPLDQAHEQRREEHLRRQRAAPAPVAATTDDTLSNFKSEIATRPLAPIFGHLADTILALRTGHGEKAAASLRKLAAHAELLALDPAIIQASA